MTKRELDEIKAACESIEVAQTPNVYSCLLLHLLRGRYEEFYDFGPKVSDHGIQWDGLTTEQYDALRNVRYEPPNCEHHRNQRILMLLLFAEAEQDVL